MFLVCSPHQMTPDTPLTAPGPRLPQRISLVLETAESLREAIRSGHWHGHLPGERELCARLQVSRQTLRSALSELEREGLVQVTQRHRRCIQQMEPPAGPAQVVSRVIAAISPRPLLAMSPSTIALVDDLRESLAHAGFSLDLHVAPSCFSARPTRALDALATRAPAAAWLLFGSQEPTQTWFVKSRRPCLVVGSCAPGVELPSVDANYRATCRHAGAMLRRKGHRSIALVRPLEAFGGDTESELGVREALEADPSAHTHIIRHDGTAQHLKIQLDRAMRSAHPPTAYIVARAVHVITVMMHMMLRGKRIPQDVAIVSRDDESFLDHATPEVTRYAAGAAQFARRVSTTVRQLAIEGSLPNRAIRLLPKLIPGQTV